MISNQTAVNTKHPLLIDPSTIKKGFKKGTAYVGWATSTF